MKRGTNAWRKKVSDLVCKGCSLKPRRPKIGNKWCRFLDGVQYLRSAKRYHCDARPLKGKCAKPVDCVCKG